MSAKRCPVGARLATVQVHADKRVRDIAQRLSRGGVIGRTALLDDLTTAKAARSEVRGRIAGHAAVCEPCNEVAS